MENGSHFHVDTVKMMEEMIKEECSGGCSTPCIHYVASGVPDDEFH